MSVSVDPKQIEKLKQLESVLGLLQNPENYTRLLAEVQVALRQYEEVTKRYATIEVAEKYLQDAKHILAKAKETSSSMYEKLESDKVAFAAKTSSVSASLSAREAAVSQKEITVAERSEKLDKDTKEFHETVTSFKKYRDSQIDLIANDAAELAKQKLLFADKAAKLAKLVSE